MLSIAKWLAWLGWSFRDLSVRRLPAGQLPKVDRDCKTNNPLVDDLPPDIIRDSLLPYLTIRDVVRIESFLSNSNAIAVLYDRLRSSELTLTDHTLRLAIRSQDQSQKACRC